MWEFINSLDENSTKVIIIFAFFLIVSVLGGLYTLLMAGINGYNERKMLQLKSTLKNTKRQGKNVKLEARRDDLTLKFAECQDSNESERILIKIEQIEKCLLKP